MTDQPKRKDKRNGNKGPLTIVLLVVAGAMVVGLYNLNHSKPPKPTGDAINHPLSGPAPIARGDGDYVYINEDRPGSAIDIKRYFVKGKYTLCEFWSPY